MMTWARIARLIHFISSNNIIDDYRPNPHISDIDRIHNPHTRHRLSLGHPYQTNIFYNSRIILTIYIFPFFKINIKKYQKISNNIK
jgi:hypothetical protein